MAEGFLEGSHVVGHVRGVGELGGTMHEVVHGCPTGVPMGEVKVAMALVVVAWGEQIGRCSPRGQTATSREQTVCKLGTKSCPSLGPEMAPAAFVSGLCNRQQCSLLHWASAPRHALFHSCEGRSGGKGCAGGRGRRPKSQPSTGCAGLAP